MNPRAPGNGPYSCAAGMSRKSPLREILNGGRPSAREEAMRERGQRLLALERGVRWNPFVEQCIGELVPAPGPAAYDAVELRAYHEVSHPKFAARGDTGRLKYVSQLFASQVLATLQCAQERIVASPEDGVAEPKLAIHVRVRVLNARRRQAQHPANIGRRDEMPGGSQQVRAQDSP